MLPRWLADDDRYVRLVELVVATMAGGPKRLVRTGFHKVRLAPDGTRDPAHTELEMAQVAVKLNAFAREGGWRAPAESPEGAEALETSAQFEERRYAAACGWEPTAEDCAQLRALVEARMDGRLRSRRRHVDGLMALPLTERLALAADAGAANWKLMALAGAPEPAVRAAVAANQAAPHEVLELLYDDDAGDVTVALAGNFNTDEAWLEQHARHADPVVRAAVAMNARTPSYVVERLGWADRHPAVRMAAQARLDRDLARVGGASSELGARLRACVETGRSRP